MKKKTIKIIINGRVRLLNSNIYIIIKYNNERGLRVIDFHPREGKLSIVYEYIVYYNT